MYIGDKVKVHRKEPQDSPVNAPVKKDNSRGYRIFEVNNAGDLYSVNWEHISVPLQKRGNTSLCAKNINTHDIGKCSCGYYSFDNEQEAINTWASLIHKNNYVVCSVLHWGDVVETKRGYRSTQMDLESVLMIGSKYEQVSKHYDVPLTDINSTPKWSLGVFLACFSYYISKKINHFSYSLDSKYTNALLIIMTALLITSSVSGFFRNRWINDLSNHDYQYLTENTKEPVQLSLKEIGVNQIVWDNLIPKTKAYFLGRSTRILTWWYKDR